jgi:lauroyl/myristoyl acyltransferase
MPVEGQRRLAPETVAPSAAAGGDALAARVAAFLRDLDERPEVVEQAIAALGEEELNHYGLRSFHLNLLAVFGERWPAARVRRAAQEATRNKLWRGWQYYAYMTHLRAGEPAAPRLLGGVPAERLRALLAGGRGLLLCACHLGDYRHIPSDLALAGLPSTTPMDADGYGQYQRTRQAIPDHPLWHHLRATNVEEPAGTLSLARALARGEIVFAYLDGNTGTDGPLGDAGRIEIEMLGYRVRVKSGIARLAARIGCPLVPVVVPRVGGCGRFRIGRAVAPGERLKGPAEERFVREAMAHLYRTFERAIRAHAAQWETCCFFHRWRAGAESAQPLPAPSLEAARREVEADLAAGRRLGMNARRIVEIRGAETIWSDARTLKAYRAPAAAPWLLDRLSPSGGGIDRQQLAERATSSLPAALSFLALLKARGALAVAGDGAGDAMNAAVARNDRLEPSGPAPAGGDAVVPAPAAAHHRRTRRPGGPPGGPAAGVCRIQPLQRRRSHEQSQAGPGSRAGG